MGIHKLANFDFSALATFGGNDDVLFSVNKAGSDKQFAVIHLTWKGSLELDSWPDTDFFKDFDDFKYNRMYSDKNEWED